MKSTENQKSLYARCTGPGAVDLKTLAARGDRAFASVSASYERFLIQKLASLAYLTKQCVERPNEAEVHTQLVQSVCDIRTSSSMAGKAAITRFSLLLEQALAQMQPYMKEYSDIVTVHISAIGVAAIKERSEDELVALEQNLLRIHFTLLERSS